MTARERVLGIGGIFFKARPISTGDSLRPCPHST